MLELNKKGFRLEQKDLNLLERQLSISLIDEYKSFLILNNGGIPNRTIFPIYGLLNNPEGEIQLFLGINQDTESSNLDWCYKTLLGRIPQNLFPIAYTGSGDLICLSLSGADRGAVFFWDHEDEHSPPSYRNIYNIANSFAQFLDCLKEYKPQYETPIHEAVCTDNARLLEQLLLSNFDLEKPDRWGRTIMENAALSNSLNVMMFLFSRGAKLRNSRAMVEENIKFMPELSQSLKLIGQMESLQ